ncbi:hypothetical protein DRQ36_09510 [bacterium]|nr:MAG: hypothetical protein DRQ36_09510 [bacterium]
MTTRIKALFCFLMFVGLYPSTLEAEPVDINTARAVAGVHLEAHRGLIHRSGIPGPGIKPEFSVSDIRELKDKNSDRVIAYIAELDPKGYIAVSVDTDIRPVIAYSYNSDFDFEDFPQNVLFRMLESDMINRLEALPRTPAQLIKENNEMWNRYLNRDKEFISRLATTTTYGPWVDTRWGQSAPFNDKCPIAPGTTERCVTGCVATAMGTIIDYWEWPPSVTFNASDNYMSHGSAGDIWITAVTANMDTIDYNGAGYFPDVETIAELLFACGVSLRMQYGIDGSSADDFDIPDVLRDKFDYAEARNLVIMNPGFYDELRENMIDAKPAELGILSMEGGHSIVTDGYRDTGEYHLNMGWQGYYDGWYFLPSGMPAGFTMVGHQVSNILPPVITRRPPVDLSARTVAGGHIRLDWEEPPHITEDVEYYKVYRRTEYTSYELIGTPTNPYFADSTTEELTLYFYAVSAYYISGESNRKEITAYSGICDGWVRTFGGDGNDVPYSVAPAPGFGCIAAGYTRVSAGSDKDLYVIRTVAGGSPVWEKTLGGDGDECGRAVVLTSDSCFIVVGMTESAGVGGSDVWLVKFDDHGDTLWSKTYGGDGDEVGMAVAETPDGGFIVAGYSDDAGIDQLYVIKTDENGDTEWERRYGNGIGGNSIANVTGGGYIAAGYQDSGPCGADDYMLIRIDAAGDSLWMKTYGGSYSDSVNCVIESDCGEFILAGNSRSVGIPLFSSIYILAVDTDGDTIWSRVYKGMGHYTANSISPTRDGGYVIAGSRAASGDDDLYILKTDATGDTIWTHIYGTIGTDIGYSAVQLADTGIVVAGKTTMNGNNDFWLFKLGGDLYSPVSESHKVPRTTELLHIYPNPFNSTVTIAFDFHCRESGNPTETVVEIFDINGCLVAEFPFNGNESAKPWSGNSAGVCRWQPDETVASGIYLISLKGAHGLNLSKKKAVYIK